jgi:hypothetical protein
VKTVKDLETFLLFNELDISIVRGTRGDWCASFHARRLGQESLGHGLSRTLVGAIEEGIADFTMRNRKAGAA